MCSDIRLSRSLRRRSGLCETRPGGGCLQSLQAHLHKHGTEQHQQQPIQRRDSRRQCEGAAEPILQQSRYNQHRVHLAVVFCLLLSSLFCVLLRLFSLGGVSSPNSWFPECSVLDILQGDPQCLHIPSDAIHPSPSWSPPWPFSWHSHVTNCSHFVVFFHSLHVSIPP